MNNNQHAPAIALHPNELLSKLVPLRYEPHIKIDKPCLAKRFTLIQPFTKNISRHEVFKDHIHIWLMKCGGENTHH